MSLTLSKGEKRRIKTLLDQVEVEEFKTLPGYWNEVRECVLRDYRRAAFVLLWGALIESLYLWIERVDIKIFANANKEKFKSDINSIDDLRDLKDKELIEGLFYAGMISEEQSKRLHHFRDFRNKYAHPTNYSIHTYDVISLLEFATEDFWSQMPKGYLPVNFFSSVIFDADYQLDSSRAEMILALLNEKNSLLLADSLISEYCHEDSLLIHPRIRLAWSQLAAKLDHDQKRHVNRKLAEKTHRIKDPLKIVLHPLVFWEQLSDIQPQHREALLTYIIKWEFAEPDEEKLKTNNVDHDSVVRKVITQVENARPQSAEECRAISQKLYHEQTKGVSQ